MKFLTLFLLLATTACSQAPVREDKDFVASINSVKLPGGWSKNPPGFEKAVYSAVFSSRPGEPWRSAIVLWTGSLSAADVRKRGRLQSGELISDRYPPVKTAHLVSDFCVDIEFQKDPKANRNTALALFECAANYTSLELVEYGQARVNEISRNALIRLVQKQIEG